MKRWPPSFATTAIAITLLHLAALVWLAKQGTTRIAQRTRKRPLMVATVAPSPQPPVSRSQVPQQAPSSSSPKKAPPRPAKAASTPRKEAPPTKKESLSPPPKRRERLAAVAKTLAKIEREELQTSLTAEVTAAFDHGRTAQLITALKRMLRLPEYGAVQVEVTLAASGVVKAIRIVSSASKRNSAYIVDQLQGATLLPAVSGGDETLLLTLTNE